MAQRNAQKLRSQESGVRSQEFPLGTQHSPLSPSAIRVVRIIDRLNVGGPTKHVVWLTAGLGKEFETVLVTGTVPDGEGDMGYFAQEAGVKPHVIRAMSRELGWRDLLVVVRLFFLFRKVKPHIVHTHKAKAGAVGRVAALLYRWMTPSALWLRPRACRVVHTYHGHVLHSYFSPLKTRVFIAIERTLGRVFTDHIVTISEQQRGELAEQFRIGKPRQFRVIPLGLDFDETIANRGCLRRELSLEDDTVLVGIVGRLCEVKHHAMFLAAVARLIENMPGATSRFVVIGDGHLRAELEALAHRLGISGRVTFTGFRRDVLALYHDLDVIALTSLNEGTPLTLLEAMACGRAVVATAVGGVVDILGTRQESLDGFAVWDHGITVPSRDTEAFAHSLQYLIERPLLRRQMGERGQAFVQTHLSRARLVRDIEELYREVVGQESGVRSQEPGARKTPGDILKSVPIKTIFHRRNR